MLIHFVKTIIGSEMLVVQATTMEMHKMVMTSRRLETNYFEKEASH